MRTILCCCGCKEEISNINKRGEYAKYKHGHNNRGKRNPNMARIQPKGEKHWNWKGGKYISFDGYVLVRNTNHPYNHNGYVLEHRLVMEKKLGRYLTPDEHIHHKNGNTKDNRISNLIKTKNNDHMKHHRLKEFNEGKLPFR